MSMTGIFHIHSLSCQLLTVVPKCVIFFISWNIQQSGTWIAHSVGIHDITAININFISITNNEYGFQGQKTKTYTGLAGHSLSDNLGVAERVALTVDLHVVQTMLGRANQ